jgi:hypothetical protein
MEKEDRNAAIWLFIICFGGSWTWLADHLYDIGLYPAIFVCLLSGFSYYAMWRIIRYVGLKTGWKKIGILTEHEQDEHCSEPSRIPIIMQAIFDASFFLIFPVKTLLSNRFEMFGFAMSLVFVTFFVIKWHNYYLFTQAVKN